MKFLRSEQKVRTGYFAAFSLLIFIYSFVFFSTIQMAKRFNDVDRAYNVIWDLELLTTSINEAESDIRGYLFFNRNDFLNSFKKNHSKADSLVSLVRKTTFQKRNADTLHSFVNEKFRSLSSFIEKSKSSDTVLSQNIWREVGNPSNKNSLQLKSKIHQMQKTEKQNFNTGTFSLYNLSSSFVITNIVGLIISLLLGIYAFDTYNKENHAKRIYRLQLEEGIKKLKDTNKELDELRSIEKFAVSGRISRTIAHEVRNPLTNINLACEQLNTNSNEDSSMLLDIIKRNSKRINNLITDLLNSTKFSELNVRQVPINAILDEALKLAGDRIDLHGIKIVRNYSLPAPKIELDPEKMKIAFLNIIINAIEAMEPGKGILEVSIINHFNKCIIQIKDNGSGMDNESLLRVFEPYFTSKNDGNGLGLTNTQNIILNHKGKISVISAPGSGTTFSIELNYKFQYQVQEVREMS